MADDNKGDTESCSEQEYSSPNEAIFFVLAYLPLFELVTISQVCRSLRDAINTDILPWLKIIVDRPLNRRISDEILMEVAAKAEGRLQVVVLINCARITDDGLFKLVAQNPRISKVHVPGCTSLSAEGIIRAVMLLTKDNHRLTTLKINGVYAVQKHHLDALHTLIHHNDHPHPIFYHDYYKFSTLKAVDTNRPIDLDVCPKCDQVTTVFDCPRPLCDSQQRQGCRGCASCIVRCAECGICMNNTQEEDEEEATCGDTLCLGCWLKLPKCNYCNKPYCNQHADQQHRLSGSTGFICANCHSKYE